MNDRDIFMNAPPDASPEALEAYLDAACGGDEELRARVEALLAAEEKAASFLDRPLLGGGVTVEAGNAPVVEGPGEVIGNYKLLQVIGEGGFGVVYMAEQLKPMRRRVAFKIIKLGMDTRQVVARFEAERQALALMDHPNIAKVFDGGSTISGRPFFVMELVRGIPITRFCDERKISTRGRLELFVEVCSAINHAHQKGIIHRDLKPSNVLVSMRGDVPVPKVIDFGIAKATQQRLTDKTLFTRFEQFVGTPVYMSPEQAGLSGEDIDTRSDIYSLGVLLYELLTGKPPFDEKALCKAGYDEMRRVIREEEPPRPSTRVGTMGGEERTTVAAAHGVDPGRLDRMMRGDVDWIVMKAIEKDRSRRYETANAFALDISRFLRNEPVSAAAPSAAYRLRKFALRNKVALGAAGAALAVVLAGGAATLVVGARHRQARAEAVYESLFDCRLERLPAMVAAVDGHAPRLDRRLRVAAAADGRPASERARARVALLPRHPEQLAPLSEWLLEASPPELGIYLGMLENRGPELAAFAWSVLSDESRGTPDRLHAAAIGAVSDPENPRWEGVADQISGWLVQAGAYGAARWLPLFLPVSDQLAPSLQSLCASERDSPTGETAAALLAEINAADPGFLVGLVRDAGPRQLPVLIQVMNRDAAAAEAALRRELAMPVPEDAGADPVGLSRQRSRLCIALLLMQRPAAVWPHLAHQPAPDLRSRLIHDIGPSGVDWRVLTDALEASADPGIVAALVAALGYYDTGHLPASVRAGPLRTRFEALFASHPDAGVRSSAEWLLRRWGMEERLAAMDAANRSGEPVGDRRWYVTRNGEFTMAILPSPIEFTMGASGIELRQEYDRESKRPTDESPHPERIGRTVAVATKQVTYDQFMAFARELEVANKNLTPGGWENPVSRTGGAAMSFVSLKEAMLYCWWFTRKEGIPEEEQCYEFDGERFADADPRTREGYLLKGGYRVLTEAEWEYACRGGTTTRRYFGSADDLLPEYGWFSRNSAEHARPPGLLLPNPLGLFDMLGNLAEWCQEPYRSEYRSDPAGAVIVGDERQHHGQPEEGRWRVFRGGSFYHAPQDLRASWRNRTPYPAHPFTGFRIARTIREGTPTAPGNEGTANTEGR